jgi:hypothetical protein
MTRVDAWKPVLLIIAFVVAASMGIAFAQLPPKPVESPDEFAARAVERMEKGDLGELARMIGTALGVDLSDGQMERHIKQFSFFGVPQFFDVVYERTFGRSVRQIIYYAPFRNERGQISPIFFNFVFMRADDGWRLGNFRYKRQVQHAIPAEWISVR